VGYGWLILAGYFAFGSYVLLRATRNPGLTNEARSVVPCCRYTRHLTMMRIVPCRAFLLGIAE
jgi:hypothetical protein